MNISVLLLLVLGTSMVMTAVFLINAIRKNFQTGQNFRIELMDAIKSMRFGKMLKKNNVSPQQFLHNHPITGIETQLKKCRACIKTLNVMTF